MIPGAPGPPFGMGAFEDRHCFGWKLNIPFTCGNIQDTKGTSSTKPTLRHFLEILQPVDKVPLGILVGEIEEVNSTCRVGNIDNNVTDLFQSIATFVYA